MVEHYGVNNPVYSVQNNKDIKIQPELKSEKIEKEKMAKEI